MGKNNKNNTSNDIYQEKQINKKHRGKSEKITKRIEKRRNKKKIKEQNSQRRNLFKYIIKMFKQRKQYIDLIRLPLDFKEIEISIKKIIAHKDKESINRILRCFDTMEKLVKEINLNTFENKSIIKDVDRLMRSLKVKQNPKYPLKYSLYHMFKKKDPKVRYTSNIEEIIRECLSSYYLLVKVLFDYYLKEENENENTEINENNNNQNIENNNNDDKNEEESEIDEKLILEEEYKAMEKQIGMNAEFINKAFSRIINDNIHKKKQNNNINNNDTNLNNLEENKNNEPIKKLDGPSASDFLKMTMDLLN